ncbi:DUF2799 domain-containing protein [uncultured Desulfobulbus sp.]|uniref:DUF2799 domain-containing protein n=1 Tax=uncultured Desulfobulbus sp. TaxID=239745 RepID=UPI0029C7AC79|nr:DUF2799 domain-containing protein [uncultured Desulfobulbus sp.]
MKIVGVFLMVALLPGCASLSREQCQRGDWYGIGMADGQAGEAASRKDQHVRACSEYGIQINDQQYFDGYDRGLEDYCRIDNAFESGLRGKRYQHVCSPAIDALFERCNRAAYEVYRIKGELDRLGDQIDSQEFRLRGTDLSDDYRHQLRCDLRELDRQYDRLRGDLYFSERYLDELRDEVRMHPIP